MTIKSEHHLQAVWFFSLCGFTAVWASFSFLSCSSALLQGKWCCIYNRQAEHRTEWVRKRREPVVKRIDFLMAQNPPTHRIRSQIISLASALYWDCARAVSRPPVCRSAASSRIYISRSLFYFYMCQASDCGKSALLRPSLLWCWWIKINLPDRAFFPPLAFYFLGRASTHLCFTRTWNF